MRQDRRPIDAHLILVVDDHGAMRECVRLALELNGYQVLEARSGLDGLHILNDLETLPGVIISDILMDDMDGFEFLDSVRARLSWELIPFVFITGAIAQCGRISARAKTDQIACLRKPFKIDDLLDAVHDFVPKLATSAV